MLALGFFVFTLSTVPYQQLERHLAWRHASTSRVGVRPARQFLGPDDETLTLSGVLAPEITGGDESLDNLRSMADEGKAWPLVGLTGELYGLFVVQSLNTTHDHFLPDGSARRIEFTLTLARVDDDQIDLLGSYLQ
ncbi:phage tail protein [Chitinimonas koreensis]|uniref:phage tail protein n=1 Tax=Chitinimonas koreensis TaxID=356302 RepID=UPI0003F87F8E|nr:phage tail protein [Chitinimonas koreensis]QNM96401.1 phage tail protein [Chitinimonas koreensis]